MRVIDDLAEIDRINSRFDIETDRIRELCEVYWHPRSGLKHAAQVDPFSRAFRQLVLDRLSEVTGRESYDPARNEKSPYLEAPGAEPIHPDCYTSGDSTWLGEIIEAHGGVLKALAIQPGQSVIEYGPGDGQIALHLARMGCHVTVVDVEPVYLARIKKQAAALQVDVKVIEGLFGDAEPGCQYDRILFYEAFHHALDHQDLLVKLRDLLKPSGSIVLAGEPILGPNDYYRPTLPYAWGPRLDGLSLRVMRAYGWCELGYAREYLVELFTRAGFLIDYRKSLATERGSAYIAKPRGNRVDLAGSCLLEAWGAADCWHPGEGNIRWSRTPVAAIPLDCVTSWTRLTLSIVHSLGFAKWITVRCGDKVDRYQMTPGETRTLTFLRSQAGARIIFECSVERPCELNPESTDGRSLGFCVSSMLYE